MSFKLLDSKKFIISVIPYNSVTRKLRCVYFGDSLGFGVASKLIDNFSNTERYQGEIPLFLGTRRRSKYRYEAVGGYGFEDYATKGRYTYRVYVSDVSSIQIGALYTIDGYPNPFEVREVNISNREGNILFEYRYGQQVMDFPLKGELIKKVGGGDDKIIFNKSNEESGNPLWNQQTEKLDVSLYKKRLGLSQSEKIDVVSFQFGINDAYLANKQSTLRKYIDDLYRAFMKDNSHCIFIVGMMPSSGNTVDGAGNNYGATFDCLNYLKNTYLLRLFYLTLSKSEYPNLRVSPASLGIDRYFGYVLDNTNSHINYVHPGNIGYQQLSDMYFSSYNKAFLEIMGF